MSKIYNEIVIDMNPESPTFEETIYEDSFEYNGDVMLAQGTSAHEGALATVGGHKGLVYLDPQGNEIDKATWDNKAYRDTQYGRKKVEGYESEPIYNVIQYTNGQWVAAGDTKSPNIKDKIGNTELKNYGSISEAPTYAEGSSQDWGAANITKEMFVDGLSGSPNL